MNITDKLFTFFSEPGTGLALIVHLLFFSIVFAATWWCTNLLKNRKTSLNIRVFTASLFISWIALELIMRMLGTYTTYLEQKNGRYVSIFKYLPESQLLKREPNSTTTLMSPGEFEFELQSNNMGYTDIAWDVYVDSHTLKILVLGDSFTEGYGATQDSGWVAQIRGMDIGRPAFWYNAAISGSDPFFNYIAFEKELHLLKPDIILQVISSQDFRDDIPMRGGMERFQPDGSIRYPERRKSEIIYAYSHASRFWFRRIMGLNQFLVCEPEATAASEKNLQQIALLDHAYQSWAETNHALIYYVFFPCFWGEVVEEKYSAEIMNYLTKEGEASGNIPIIDLIPCYREYYLREQEAFQQRWWPRDGHHNSTGYQMMAGCLATSLKDILASDVAPAE